MRGEEGGRISNKGTLVSTEGKTLVMMVLGAAAMLPMGGCLISSHNSEDFSGKYVSSMTYNQIEPGVTRADWIQATLGEPTSKSTLEDGSELWKWSYVKTKKSSGSLLFVFNGSDRKQTAGSVYAQIKDGVVVKTWRTDEN